MPAFAADLDNWQVAAVATFVRNSWGNEYGLVREEWVANRR
jgi:mono/diheme cytochrome c family protein